MHGDLRESVLRLKEQTPEGVLLGSGALAVALDRLDLIDEFWPVTPSATEWWRCITVEHLKNAKGGEFSLTAF